jgi:hypothetical protein
MLDIGLAYSILEARSIGNYCRDRYRQPGDSEVLMSEKAEACFVLPLRVAAAQFACRNARSAEAEMGVSNNGNAHASIIHRFSASKSKSSFNKVLASLTRRLSVDTTKGDQCRRCSSQGSGYFFFF